MISVTILGGNDNLKDNVKLLLSAYPNIKVCEVEKDHTDILILSEQHNCNNITTKYLIISDRVNKLDGVSAEIAISGGISDVDTVTISSAAEGKEMASLQREILSFYGNIIEPREIDLSKMTGSTEDKMLICSLMLVLEI